MIVIAFSNPWILFFVHENIFEFLKNASFEEEKKICIILNEFYVKTWIKMMHGYWVDQVLINVRSHNSKLAL